MPSIKHFLQDIRYGDVKRRKKWLVTMTVLAVVVVLILWLFVFGVQTAISEKTVSQSGENEAAVTDFWKSLTESMQYAKETFTASMGLINNVSSTEEIATTTPSASPTSTAVELQ